MGDFGSSLVRTVVPLIVGGIISVLLYVGVEVDESTKAALVSATTGIVTAAWYALFRWLEVHVNEKFGWLLGLAKPPSY